MSRVVWLNGRFVDAATAALPIDDPGCRYGEGLFESMRADEGRIPELDRHLRRLDRSRAAVRLVGLPGSEAIAEAAMAVAARLAPGVAKIRVTVTALPTLLVEGTRITPAPMAELSAITLPGAWLPDRWLAEHKTLSFLGWRDAQRRADAAGADTALLLDCDGRLGEAATANVFAVVGDEIRTAPARGLLPGTTRETILERFQVREVAASADEWRSAREIFISSAIKRVGAVVAVDGRPVADGRPGPVTRQIAEALAPSHGSAPD